VGWFNRLPSDEAREQLRACNAAERFVSELAAGRPYTSAADVADTAEAVSRGLSWAEVSRALDAHPRIGDQARGDTAQARSSRAEQASMDSAGDAVRSALAEGNRAYEERFGHVYLIRAAGRSPAQLLAELQRRLGNDAETERGEVTRELAEITRLRVERLVRT
jgi:2-oxo-4-hydroxy-4-carboxy-5-ureidoimidazoline decarboxylase